MLTRIARLSTRRSWRVVRSPPCCSSSWRAPSAAASPSTSPPAGSTTRPPSRPKADEALAEQFGTGIPNIILLVTAHGRRRRRPRRGRRRAWPLTDELAAEADVTDVVSYWSEGNAPPLRSDDGDRALVARPHRGRRRRGRRPHRGARPRLPADRRRRGRHRRGRRLRPGLPRGRHHHRGGPASRAEMIALPITLVLLVLIFGSVVAASPAAGRRRAVDRRHVLRAAGCCRRVTDVSVYALNLTTALGPRASPSTTACSSSPATGRSCGPATSPAPPWSAPCAPPAARSPSAP